MLKQSELLELTDEDLLALIGTNVVIRLSLRNPTEPTEDEDEDLPSFKSVTAVGTLLELQYSGDTGGAVASLYSGTEKPDEVRWDCDEYRADFVWVLHNF